MLFKRTKDDPSWTGMAIYFDSNFWSENINEAICYRYVYLLIYMLACKKQFFSKFKEYDDYAQYATNVIYIRFLKKKKKGDHVKSVLNYLKKTLYALKIMYQNATYKKDISKEVINNNSKMTYLSTADTFYTDGLKDDVNDCLNDIINITNSILKQTPYKKDKAMYQKLYMSCLITLLKGFTLSNADLMRLNDPDKIAVSDKVLIRMYSKARQTSVTTWRLDSRYSQYVEILTNKIRKELMDSILEIQSKHRISDDTLSAMFYSDLNYQKDEDYE